MALAGWMDGLGIWRVALIHQLVILCWLRVNFQIGYISHRRRDAELCNDHEGHTTLYGDGVAQFVVKQRSVFLARCEGGRWRAGALATARVT